MSYHHNDWHFDINVYEQSVKQILEKNSTVLDATTVGKLQKKKE
jgi:hypothetical protein